MLGFQSYSDFSGRGPVGLETLGGVTSTLILAELAGLPSVASAAVASSEEAFRQIAINSPSRQHRRGHVLLVWIAITCLSGLPYQ